MRKPFGMQLTVSAKVFSEMAKEFFFLAKVLEKVHVHMSKFALYIFVLSVYYVLMFHVVKTIGGFFGKVWRKFC